MKNGKHILLLMICLNLVSGGFTFICTANGSTCGESFDNGILNFFFDYSTDLDLSQTSGLTVNGNMTAAVESSLQQESGLANIGGSIGLLDVIRMVLGFIALLTPFPLLLFFSVLGIPLLFMGLFSVPIFAIYTICIIEFLRGGEF